MNLLTTTAFSSLIFSAFITSAAASPPITATQTFYEPYSRTAAAITGPITISKNALVFSTKATANLEIISEAVKGQWGFSSEVVSVQLFKITSNPGVLLNGNTLCGKNGPPTYLTAYKEESSGGSLLQLAVFRGSVAPTSVRSDNLCGTYNYE